MDEKQLRDKKKKSYIWNTISGILNAGQSAIILIFVSRNYGVHEAGVFSISYAIGLLCMTLAKYGQRTFQVTDVSERFSFLEYRMSRVVSITITMFFLLIFITIQLLNGTYGGFKAITVFMFVIWKMIDVVEDLYYGMYQQLDHLDIGAKRYSERLFLSTVLFCIISYTKIMFEMLLIIVTGVSIILAVFFIKLDYSKIIQKQRVRIISVSKVKELIIECAPLCLGTTLGVFVGNMPKYLIDMYSEESIQAFFGYIIMPSFVVTLLSNFVFQPIIKDMGVAFKNKDSSFIKRTIHLQLFLIFVVTGLVIVLSFLIGIPVLDILYKVKLSAYKKEMIFLLLGGGCYAAAQFMMVPITILRRQKDIAGIYVMIVVISIILGRILVQNEGIYGASILYMVINFLLLGGLLVDYIIRYKRVDCSWRNDNE